MAVFRKIWRQKKVLFLVGCTVILLGVSDVGKSIFPFTQMLQPKRATEENREPILKMFVRQMERHPQPDPWYVMQFVGNGPSWKTQEWNESEPSYILREHSGWLDTWQQISPQLFLYSAYWDDRDWVQNAPLVRIFAASSTQPNELLTDLTRAECLMRYEHRELGHLVVRKVNATYAKVTKDNSTEQGYEFICKDPLGGEESPSDVTLTTNKQDESQENTWIKVHQFQASVTQTSEEPTFGVCVKPLTSELSKVPNVAWQIADFIAYYQVLGASKFTFYDDGCPASVRRIIYDLSNEGLPVQLLPWSVDLKDLKLTWRSYSDNVVMSAQDCVYRNMYKQQYTLVVGVDQFVVPRSNSSLSGLIQDLSQAVEGYFADVRFAHALFCTNYPDKAVREVQFPLLSHKKTYRRQISEAYQGSQYLAKTEAVEWAGANVVSKRKILTPVKWVATDVALLHQYAEAQGPSLQCGIFNEDQSANLVVEDNQLPLGYGTNVTNLISQWQKYLSVTNAA
ncbi:uncharacterized protein LOC106475326 [Limulus polyphemus]|uniref:Glycosyltransferase family 92 protein n=1 Tax=Limulus polyphemus TaxID=6850 RepID=A0ABM1BZ82_LIMPO|nr:uncharacterized protein LOC106475326 [Limulus polyphemus]